MKILKFLFKLIFFFFIFSHNVEDSASAYEVLNNAEKFVNTFGEKNEVLEINKHLDAAPSLGYETLRKKIQDDVQEFWFYISAQLAKLNSGERDQSPEFALKLDKLLRVAREHKLYVAIITF